MKTGILENHRLPIVFFSSILVLGEIRCNLFTASWSSVSTGLNHNLAIQSDGTLWTWGANDRGQLGDGMWFRKSLPESAGNAKWIAVSAGYKQSYGIKDGGTLWGWGDNQFGDLGTISTDNCGDLLNHISCSLAPIQIGTATWIAIVSSATDNLGIQSDGTLWTWSKRYDQPGDGTIAEPVQFGTALWKAIATSDIYKPYYLGIQIDETLWAWGGNFFGELGDGTTMDKTSPVQIGSSKWISIAVGNSFSLGIKTDGTLWAWGDNGAGQLGDGTTIGKTSPVQIGTATWIAIAAGSEQSYGIQTDGTLWAWGGNFSGELGDGTTESRNLPAQIGSLKWISVTAGDGDIYGIQIDGTLWSWGLNSISKQLVPTLIW